MNKKEKLLKRFRLLPRDFTFEEMTMLFKSCGFELSNKGSTSGSRVEFYNERDGKSYINAQTSSLKHCQGLCHEAGVYIFDNKWLFKRKGGLRDYGLHEV